MEPITDGMEERGRLHHPRQYPSNRQLEPRSPNTTIQGGNSGQTGADNGSELGRSISSGFRIAKSISETAGVAFGGEQVFSVGQQTDTGRNLYLIATKGWWLGNQGNDYPLLIANGGFGTDATPTKTNGSTLFDLHASRILRIETGHLPLTTICAGVQIGSLSIIFNDYVSTFVNTAAARPN